MLKLNRHVYVLVFLLFLIFLPSFLFAERLTPLQKQAQAYRERGIQYQRQGRIDGAMACYQKAITIDPSFVTAYNDLGIIYEAKGWQNRAEQVYLAALEVDPTYPNIYSNLALLYEQKRDYQRAAEFWQKRINLGGVDGAWLEAAREKLEALREFIPQLKQKYLQEEAGRLAEELEEKKRIKRVKDLAEANRLFEEAKLLYKKSEYEKALNSIDLALLLNSEDSELLLRLKEEINTRLIEQKKQARISLMQIHFQKAMECYQQDNLQAAERELKKITAEITSSNP